MKTKKGLEKIPNTQMDKHVNILLSLMVLIATVLMAMALISCSSDDPATNPDSDQTGTVSGTVKDESGNPYPNTVVTFSKGSEKNTGKTNAEGMFSIGTKNIGTYSGELKLPLSTEMVSTNPASANVQANQAVTIDFVIKPSPIEAVLSLGDADVFDEIRDKDGNMPSNPNEPLYAANFFQPPIGFLTAIKTPDGHHVTLSEFQQAKGTFKVHCNGETSTVEIALEGMIPGGTYTTWLGYLKTIKKIGDPLSGADFVYSINPPLGASNGSENVMIADGNGSINVTIVHPSCILTDEVALGMPVSYHLNGNTYGGGEIPDVEEVTQLLVYFQ